MSHPPKALPSLIALSQQGKEAWLAFKAANGVPNHNDLDGGSFVLEMGGQRWAIDLGADSYQLPGYWTQSNTARYRWYRKSTAGHNTLTFNRNDATPGTSGQDPTRAGITQITLFEHSGSLKGPSPSSEGYVAAGGSPAYSIVDLTAAYRKQGATRVQRGFAFTAGFKQLLCAWPLGIVAGALLLTGVCVWLPALPTKSPSRPLPTLPGRCTQWPASGSAAIRQC